MPESWENDPDWWKGEASEGEEGFEGRGRPVILDQQIWGIAKRVKVEPRATEQETKLVYWATVVKLYREMGGRIEFEPTPD
ncbi:MAG TPA: hypothetical protein VJI96_01795 [Candidatus Andersenbacteria bacterium]|nr:hypothetical protein [Candidatus Andersenbacteria bacterium]